MTTYILDHDFTNCPVHEHNLCINVTNQYIDMQVDKLFAEAGAPLIESLLQKPKMTTIIAVDYVKNMMRESVKAEFESTNMREIIVAMVHREVREINKNDPNYLGYRNKIQEALKSADNKLIIASSSAYPDAVRMYTQDLLDTEMVSNPPGYEPHNKTGVHYDEVRTVVALSQKMQNLDAGVEASLRSEYQHYLKNTANGVAPVDTVAENTFQQAYKVNILTPGQNKFNSHQEAGNLALAKLKAKGVEAACASNPTLRDDKKIFIDDSVLNISEMIEARINNLYSLQKTVGQLRAGNGNGFLSATQEAEKFFTLSNCFSNLDAATSNDLTGRICLMLTSGIQARAVLNDKLPGDFIIRSTTQPDGQFAITIKLDDKTYQDHLLAIKDNQMYVVAIDTKSHNLIAENNLPQFLAEQRQRALKKNANAASNISAPEMKAVAPVPVNSTASAYLSFAKSDSNTAVKLVQEVMQHSAVKVEKKQNTQSAEASTVTPLVSAVVSPVAQQEPKGLKR